MIEREKKRIGGGGKFECIFVSLRLKLIHIIIVHAFRLIFGQKALLWNAMNCNVFLKREIDF